jgi:hypothetical protein
MTMAQTRGQGVIFHVSGRDWTEVTKFSSNTTTTKSAGDIKKLKKGASTNPPPNPVNERIVPANKTVTHINKNREIEGNSWCHRSRSIKTL